MQEILADSNFMQKRRYKCTTLAYMHHDSEKIQAIHSSVTVLSLLMKKEEERR